MAIFPGMISLDGETIAQVNAMIMKERDTLPSRDDASYVVGASDEHATAAFMRRLTKVADQLGDHTNVVRVVIADHVDVMQKAASSMQDRDEHDAAWVKQQDTMFDDVADSTTKKNMAQAQETVQDEHRPAAATSGGVQNATDSGSGSSGSASAASDTRHM